MKVSERLIKSAADIWDRYLVHPFVTGIARGDLDQEKFKFYMIQDYLYLLDYAKVFAIGVAKSTDTDTMGEFSEYIYHITNGEMDIHRSYMERLGITKEDVEKTPLSYDNILYTSYMLREAYEGGAAEVVAAILSCAVSYEFIGRHIAKVNPDSVNHPFFGEWVRGYSSDDYIEANVKLTALIDRLTEGYTEEKIQHLCDIFVICSRCEEEFWNMAWEMRA